MNQTLVRHTRVRHTLARALVATLLVLVGAGGAARADDLVMIDGAWSRALPPVAKVGAAYLKVRNVSGSDAVLVGVDASIAERAELHEHTNVDGMMRMREVTSVALPAGATVSFEPHGMHVMLFGLSKPLKVGSEYELTLRFASGAKATTVVRVRQAAP